MLATKRPMRHSLKNSWHMASPGQTLHVCVTFKTHVHIQYNEETATLWTRFVLQDTHGLGPQLLG